MKSHFTTSFHKIKPILLSNEIVRCYYFASIEKVNTGILVEDGCCEFMFIKETDIKIKTGQNKIVNLPKYFGIGKVPMPYKFIFPGSITIFSIKLQPWVGGFFFGSSENGIYALNDIKHAGFELLHRKIFTSKNYQEMVEHAESHLRQLSIPTVEYYEVSKKICEKINTTNGVISSKAIVSQFPYSRQKVNRLFLRQTKNSIKEYSVYVRIRALLDYKSKNEDLSLTNIAYDFGYFDQSHFIKDFKKATGVAPSIFLRSKNSTSSQL